MILVGCSNSEQGVAGESGPADSSGKALPPEKVQDVLKDAPPEARRSAEAAIQAGGQGAPAKN